MDNIELYSLDIEKNILGCIVVFEECNKYIKRLNEKDFYTKNHKTIFSIIQTLYKNKSNIDIISIKEKAKSLGLHADKVFTYTVKLTEKVITSATMEEYMRRLKNYSVRREILEKTKNIVNEVYKTDIEEEAGEIKKKCMKELADIQTSYVNLSNQDMSSVIAEATQSIEDRYLKRDDNTYKTGIFDLDKITDGLHEQELTVIAARPGVGKTSFALQIAEHIAEKDVYTYFVSLEMSGKQLGNRLIANKTRIDTHKLRCGWLEEKDFIKIGEEAAQLSQLKMIIDTTSTTIQDIEIKAVELKETKNIGLIIIDYLQLLKSKDKFNIREQEVADISRRLKLLSRDLNIPVVALCQLNRETEKRKRPMLADLRESGSIEQDADNVIFLYIEEEEKTKQGIVNVDLILAKQRNGPTGEIKIRFNKQTMQFVNLER